MTASIVVPNRAISCASLLLPCIAGLALIAMVPGNIHPSTYGAIVALVVGSSVVAMGTWQNAQPVASLRQAVYLANHRSVAISESRWGRLAIAR